MIIKNESLILDRCLSSITPAIDELIIVDTGSSDTSKQIAQQYNALIYDYTWNDNFSDARNFAFSKASMDYCLWMDADDVINKINMQKLLSLKQSLSADTDMVMFPYASNFSTSGNPSFLYYRERLIKNNTGFLWEGVVHECITPKGNIVYSDIIIEHRPIQSISHTERNLKIFNKYIQTGADLSPREQFYYARELMAAQHYAQAAEQFISIIYNNNTWKENRIEACRNLSSCYLHLGHNEEALEALLKSFCFDVPRAETLCDLGDLFRTQGAFTEAIYWYERALQCEEHPEYGGFINTECYGYYPCIQLCVCYFNTGQTDTAFKYHKMCKKWHTDTPEYKYNEIFFNKYYKNSPAFSHLT